VKMKLFRMLVRAGWGYTFERQGKLIYRRPVSIGRQLSFFWMRFRTRAIRKELLDRLR
jgi:hypothetical protein